ncbi:hypothetical protein EMCRGX_G005485 [Ephydatia muelleri]
MGDGHWRHEPGPEGVPSMEGCLEHNHLITSVLQDSRKRPAFLTWLDLKDAYGSVPHEILLKAMELAGLEGTTLRIVEDFYHQTATAVKTKHATTHPITIRRKKKRAKRRAKYLEVQDDVLESARASYKADQEKKRTAERERYQADPENKRSSAKRESYQAEPEKKQTAECERYQADPEKKQTAEREHYKADPEKKRSAKGNVIGRVLNVLAWRRECGTGRLSVVPTRPSKKYYRQSYSKLLSVRTKGYRTKRV